MLGFGAGVSYLLAGKTLRPIEGVFSAQRRFISDAAHELKTPLTALRTAIEVSLLDKKIGKTAETVLTENLHDVTNLQALTENLLSLAKTQEGAKIDCEAVSLLSIAQLAKKQVSAMAKKKQIVIALEEMDGELLVLSNEQNLLRVLLVLLDNAIKYSPAKSEITITASKSKRMGKISVNDQGEGIPVRHHNAIFDRFYRVSSARTKHSEVGGHGLGLAVAKELVEAMGGSISLKTGKETGNSFSVVLPLG